MNIERERNCYDAIKDIDEAIGACLNTDQHYLIVGGTASGAYSADTTNHVSVSRTSFVKHDTGPSIMRPENNTRRDVDILVIGESPLPDDQAEDIVATVSHFVPDLEVSVFGLKQHLAERSGIGRLQARAFSWLSERTIDENKTIRYELYPLSVEINQQSLEPWKVVVDESMAFNALHPSGHLMAYLLRSISGVRYKDAAKIGVLADAILANPELKSEITDGVFSEWYDFARAVWAVRDGLPADRQFIQPEATDFDIKLFKSKSRALRQVEKHPVVIKLAQSDVGIKSLKRFIGNS